MKNQELAANPVKSKAEIEALRRACDLSSRLHIFAMGINCLNMSEFSLAEKLNKFKREQSDSEWAYDLLVASGMRSTGVLTSLGLGRQARIFLINKKLFMKLFYVRNKK